MLTSGSYDGTYFGSFDGASHYIDLSTRGPGSAFTIAVWVNITACSSETRTILANTNATATGYRFVYDCNTKRLQFVTRDGSNTTIAQTVQLNGSGSNPPSIEDSWHHVAAVVNATNNTAFLYVDGAIWNDGSAYSTQAGFATNAITHIGQFTDNANRFSVGMDDLKIFLRELNSAEVVALATP